MKSGSRKTRTLDMRPVIARGDPPFPVIMNAVAALGATEDLLLITPFLPSPLIEKLQSDGFQAQPERRSDGGWETRFVRGLT